MSLTGGWVSYAVPIQRWRESCWIYWIS